MKFYIDKEEIFVTEKFDFPTSIRERYDNAILNGDSDQPFYVCDVGDIVNKHRLWCMKLPRIQPYYAMKCNPDDLVVGLLAKMQVGFDCASQLEIKKAIASGVPSERIIYANPCKPISHIKYAESVGVKMMTFDSLLELKKVSVHHPDALMVLRIYVGVSKAVCPLGLKFGASLADVSELLLAGIQLNVKIIGVSFHVGSGCFDASAYSVAIKLSREVFDLGLSIGHPMRILDIGGGFPGNIDTIERVEFFESVCFAINDNIEKYFNDPGIEIIAEPGRFYVSSAFQLACSVTSIRISPSGIDDNKINYFLNDGVYGSFNCIIYDHYIGEHYLLNDITEYRENSQVFDSVFWGPTCDNMDKIIDCTFIRKIDIGECIVFKNMGAYTMAAGCTFNGFPRPVISYCCGLESWKFIESLSPVVDLQRENSCEVNDSFEVPSSLETIVLS